MIVAFNIELSGQNDDLEIKGTTQYSFYKIYTRKFLDLFPFWQKFVNPKADANKITEFGGSDEATINDAKYAIKNNGGIWQIIYEYKINR